MRTTSKPNGSAIQRQRRKIAAARRAVVEQMTLGRHDAVNALLQHARVRAIPMRMPSLPPRNRVARWLFDKAAVVVARHIERVTFKRAVNRLESLKLGGPKWELGVWHMVCVMKGTVLP